MQVISLLTPSGGRSLLTTMRGACSSKSNRAFEAFGSFAAFQSPLRVGAEKGAMVSLCRADCQHLDQSRFGASEWLWGGGKGVRVCSRVTVDCTDGQGVRSWVSEHPGRLAEWREEYSTEYLGRMMAWFWLPMAMASLRNLSIVTPVLCGSIARDKSLQKKTK